MHRSTERVLGSLCAVTMCACAAHAVPFYVGLEYTGSLILNGIAYNDVLITMEGKGLTENLTFEQTTAGRLYELPVSMTMSIEGPGYADVAEEMKFFVYADVGAAGFGRRAEHASYIFNAPELTNFDFTWSIVDATVLQGGGMPGQIMFTGLGIVDFRLGGPGTVTAVVHSNPAPGVATALALPAVVAGLRRRRP